MIRTRTTEDPGFWKVTHEFDSWSGASKVTLEAYGQKVELVKGDPVAKGDPLAKKRMARGPRTTDRMMEEIHAVAEEVAASVPGVTVEHLKGPQNRTPRIVDARKAAMWLARHRLGANDTEIGVFFRRNRTTVVGFIADVHEQLAEHHRAIELKKTEGRSAPRLRIV